MQKHQYLFLISGQLFLVSSEGRGAAAPVSLCWKICESEGISSKLRLPSLKCTLHF